MKIRYILAACGLFAPAALAQDGSYRAVPLSPKAPKPVIIPAAGDGPGLSANWSTVDGGGGQLAGALGYTLNGTVGQPDAGLLTGGIYEMGGGYWNLADEIVCYANCDGSTGAPMLTANDLTCFINNFATQTPYANCDGSTGTPALTANDFTCFINAFALGCS